MREIIVVLHNIRSTYNVGAILRTAEGFGIDTVAYSGYTPRCNDSRILPHLRAKLDRQIAKSALGAEELVPQENIENLIEWIKTRRGEGYEIIGLENNLSSEEMARRRILEPGVEFGFGKKVVLLLGEEVDGIPPEIRPEMDAFLEIPMCGKKESFNVSVAAGIAMFALSQHQK